MSNTIRLKLNSEYIQNRIEELDLKYSWLAYKIGVTEKTIQRWASGKVKFIRSANALKLAECLECGLDKILAEDNSLALGRRADKYQTIKILFDDGYIYKYPISLIYYTPLFLYENPSSNLICDRLGLDTSFCV